MGRLKKYLLILRVDYNHGCKCLWYMKVFHNHHREKTAKYVAKEEALDYVFGYCAANDLSARDQQMRTQQWLLGKSCSLGPYLVTADEVGDPNALDIKCIVNGEVRQHSNTADMIFRCDEIVSYISRHMTLMPGDIVLTGTPEGVVLGKPPENQVYLKAGDIVTINF